MEHFTADSHFGHANIIQYSNRPFNSVDGMNRALIANWNSVVRPEDIVYHVGDFSFMNERETESILRQLNGTIHFIYGNHDKVIRKSTNLHKYFASMNELKEIDVRLSNGNKQRIVLCHYAMLVWNKSHHGSWMLHGHSHGSLKYPIKGKIMDVGTDPRGFFPISLREVERHMATLESESVDHHGD